MLNQAQAVAGSSEPPPVKTRVFISYSRKDGAFAEKLRVTLIALGFEAYLDKEDILPGEPWRARLEGLILAADAVVFVMTPDSIASKHCQWEVARTLELKKSLVPLYWRAVPSGAVPEGLSERNYVYFDAYERSGMADEAAFQEALGKLKTALNIAENLWVREHTKWVARAAEWDKVEPRRPEGKLLPSGDIAAVEAWKQRKPASGPEIPSVLADYLTESIAKDEGDKTRRLHAFVQPVEAAVAEGRYDHALRLMAAGSLMAEDPALARVPELWITGARVVLEGRLRAVFIHDSPVHEVQFSPDGTRIVTSSNKTRLWDATTARQIAILEGIVPEVGATFSADSRRLITMHSEIDARLWDSETGEQVGLLRGARSARFCRDGQNIITTCLDGTARLWNGSTGEEIVILMSKLGNMTRTVFSADAQRCVTVSPDGWAQLWDIAAKQEIATVGRVRDGGLHATFSPNGCRLLITQEGTRLWDSDRGNKIAELLDLENFPWRAVFNADSGRIITESADKTARLWDAETGKEVASLNARAMYQPIASAWFDPTGQQIISVDSYGTALLQDAVSGTEVARLDGHKKGIVSAAFSPDSRRVLTASSDGTARIWNAKAGKQIAVLRGHEKGLHIAMFSPDGRWAVTASDNTVRLWDGGIEQDLVTIEGKVFSLEYATFSPKGNLVMTVSKTSAQVWDVDTGRELATLDGHQDSLQSAAFSPNGRQIVTASLDGTARLWDVDTGKAIGVLRGHQGSVNSAAFSPDGRQIVTTSSDGAARLWDVETRVATAILKGQETNILKGVFSPDGLRVVTVSLQGIGRLWNTQEGQEINVLRGHSGGVFSAAFSTDGQRIVTASFDRTARLWDGETGQIIAVLRGHAREVNSATFSADGRTIVTASWDNTARIWNGKTGKEIAALIGHTDQVRSAAFSPDGRQVVTASDDGSARLWNVTTAKEILILKGHTNQVCSATFSPDGRRVLTASEDGTARLWSVSRAASLTGIRALDLATMLGCGVGRRTEEERKHPLMRHAPDELHSAVFEQLERTGEVDRTTTPLRASNSYVSRARPAVGSQAIAQQAAKIEADSPTPKPTTSPRPTEPARRQGLSGPSLRALILLLLLACLTGLAAVGLVDLVGFMQLLTRLSPT